MNTNETNEFTNRRNFIGKIATGTAAIGLTTIAPSLNALAGKADITSTVSGDPEEFFKKINGKHRVVFDVPKPNEVMPFAWPKVFLITNEMTGTPNKDCSVVVVLRHSAIGYALENRLWTKYKLGEVFKADDPLTKSPSLRNPFWKPKPGDFKIPGIGNVEIGINELQASGVMFCACNMAITVYSAILAEATGKKAEDVKKEWLEGVLPGIEVMPSGVWARVVHRKNNVHTFLQAKQ